jgi:hypothetical protein
MTPIRIGASWARTSLPKLAAATAAAEFLISDLRDVAVGMVTSLILFDGRDRQPFAQYLDNLFWSQRGRT